MERRKGLTARRLMALFCVSALLVVVCATVVLGADKAKYSPVVFSTGWALLPPVVAIALA